MINNTDIMTAQTITPAPTTTTTITLQYTVYEPWSGRSYYGPRSGVRAVPMTTTIIVGRETDKAVMVHPVRDHRPVYTERAWLPKSALTESTIPGIWTLGRSFCYRIGFRWQFDHGAARRSGVLVR